MNNDTLAKANTWLSDSFDQDTRDKVQALIDSNPEELEESFYKDLDFGTGGLRGKMGVGTNRINKYTIGLATQGLCNYVKSQFDGDIKIAIAYDSRNNSAEFARNAADVITANGITAHLFKELRPTPELSFAIRELGCHAGIVITASHNPKEYNGYKVYWNDGAQLVAPHDKNVIEEVRKLDILDIANTSNDDLLKMVNGSMDTAYIDQIKTLSLQRYWEKGGHDLKIVYTPLHGTGVTVIPNALKAFGFNHVHVLESQKTPDGNFPTTPSPNPEEEAAMELALQKAAEIDADIVLATDPDTDRVGIAVKNLTGKFILLNGNQAASILVYYLLENLKEQDALKGNEFVVKTIVTSDLIKDICDHYKVKCLDTLTGFKYIAEQIRNREGKEKFIGGGEESYGYLVGDFVRDKDAVIASVMLCEIAAWGKDNNLSLYRTLLNIYKEFGIYKEKLVSIKKEGKSGAEEIAQMMEGFRSNPPEKIGPYTVEKIADYQAGETTTLKTGAKESIELPKSNVLQFLLEGGSKITARPSGTEPKIKFYFSGKIDLHHAESPERMLWKIDRNLDKAEKDLLS